MNLNSSKSQGANRIIRTVQASIAILLLLFFIASFIFISPSVPEEKSNYHSTQLKKIITQDENIIRTDYVDENNKITVAAELGFSTIIVAKTDHGELESYYNDEGERVKRRYLGYYSVLREYDEKGKLIHVVYMNKNREPVVTSDGYAEEKWKYSEQGKVATVFFYDSEGQSISTEASGYGKTYEYNAEGKVDRIKYLDSDGYPMKNRQGYAVVSRNYYANGKLESELYFDENDNPVALSLGQYGVHKEYDKVGQESVLTYLDADGNAINTHKGYATIKRTYQANGKTATERYFDKNGKPFALSEGQYGVAYLNNQTVYLDQNGKPLLNIRNMLYNYPWIICICVIILVIISALLCRKLNWALLFLYCIVIIYITLMFREHMGSNKIMVFDNIKKILKDSETRSDIIKNIWLFIPIGTILFLLYPRKIMLIIPIVLSICIEGIQYITQMGFCELDDVICNGIGGCIGCCLGKLTIDIKNRINKRKHVHSM